MFNWFKKKKATRTLTEDEFYTMCKDYAAKVYSKIPAEEIKWQGKREIFSTAFISGAFFATHIIEREPKE